MARRERTLEEQIEYLREKLDVKLKAQREKEEKESMKIFRQMKSELPKFKKVINQMEDEKKIYLKYFLLENKLKKIHGFLFEEKV